MNKIQLIQIDQIGFDETQTRLMPWEGDEKDETLQSSIRGTGLIHEVIVRPKPEHSPVKKPYILVVGSRRFSAMVQIGMSEVPCKVIELTDVQAIGMSLNENLGRRELSIFEKVRSIRIWYELLKETGLTEEGAVKEIAKGTYGDTDRGKNHIYHHLKASELPGGLDVVLKDPDKRTKKEIKLLRDHGIPLDFQLAIGTVGGAIADVLRTEVLSSLSDSEKADAIFTIIGTLKLGKKGTTAKDQLKVLRIVLKELETGKSLTVVMKKLGKERKHRIGHAAGFKITIPALYESWHVKAMTAARAKDPGAFVRKIYISYLKRRAKKEGW